MPAGELAPLAKERLAQILKDGKPIATIFQCIGTDCRFR